MILKRYDKIMTRLVDRHGQFVTNICARELRDFHDIELIKDTVQDVFIKATANYSSFRKKSSESTWKYVIAVNTCKDIKKSPRWKKEVSVDFDKLTDSLPMDEKGYDKIEEEDFIWYCFNQLNEGDREILEMKIIDDVKNKDIAKALGISENVANQRISRAMKRLRAIAAKEEELKC